MYVGLQFFFLIVFASTAADPYHSSYACYFDKRRRTYLGDVYSVNWMQDSDKVRTTKYPPALKCSCWYCWNSSTSMNTLVQMGISECQKVVDSKCQTCLGDMCSVNWRKDSDNVRMTNICLLRQLWTLSARLTWEMCTVSVGCMMLTRWEQ